MKKIFAIVLMLVMIFSIFTGCSDERDPDGSSSQGENNQKTEVGSTYYDFIEITNEAFESGESPRPEQGMIAFGYEQFAKHFSEATLSKVDENKFKDKTVVFCGIYSSVEVLGFKNLEYSNSSPVITCEYTSSVKNQGFFTTIVGECSWYAVLVPDNEIPYGVTKVGFEAEKFKGYASKMVAHAPQLGNEEKFYFFKTSEELSAFEEENGLTKYSGYNVGTNVYVAVHYVPITYHNQITAKYKSLEFSSENTFEIERVEFYDEECGVENRSYLLYYIQIPRTVYSESENLSGSVVTSREVFDKEEIPAPQAKSYLSVLSTLRGDECDELDFLPADYGTHFWLPKNEIDLAELGMPATVDNNRLHQNYYVLVVYRKYKDHNFEMTGYRDLRVENGKIILTVDESKNGAGAKEFESLSYILVPKKLVDESGLGAESFVLESNEVFYYNSVKGRSKAEISVKSQYYMYDTYEEFKKFWSNDVDESVFENYFAFVIPRYYGSDAYSVIGYRDFYCEGTTIYITVDEKVEIWGNDVVVEGYDVIFIPRELLCLKYKLVMDVNCFSVSSY